MLINIIKISVSSIGKIKMHECNNEKIIGCIECKIGLAISKKRL